SREHSGRAVEMVCKSKLPKTHRLPELMEQLTEERNLEVVPKILPAEWLWLSRMPPQRPGGEDSVEGCLDQGGAQELLGVAAFEMDSQSLRKVLEEGLDRLRKLWRERIFRLPCHASQDPRQGLRLRDRRKLGDGGVEQL